MEVPRVALRRLMVKVFMGFKQIWLQKCTNVRKIAPFIEKTKDTRVKNAMVHWKWLIYYKHTKRAYLKFKKDKYEYELKRDVFLSLKIQRQIHYSLVNVINKISKNLYFKTYQYTFQKIRNDAANDRDELFYERRRALFTILKGKIAKQDRIKVKILKKWHAHLI